MLVDDCVLGRDVVLDQGHSGLHKRTGLDQGEHNSRGEGAVGLAEPGAGFLEDFVARTPVGILV